VTATGHPTPAYQWRRDALALGGATSATLTLASVQSADAGSYDVVVSNPLGGVTSAAATLTVNAAAVAPTITTQPLPQLAYAGQTVTFAVVAHGTAPLTYQWFKDSTARGGATTATLVLPNVQPADAGIYTVVITNGAGNATSRDATLSVIPSGFTGQHAVIGHGYLPGGTVQITTMIAYTGTLSGLGYQVLLPAGLSYAAGSGTEAEIKPVAGKVGLLEWTWTTLPASPVTFTYTLNFAPGTTGLKNLSGLITTHPGPILFLSQPDPLVVNQITHHSADTDRNFRLSLNELTRVIEIYNTYHGTVRTGCYAGLTGTEDGYVAAPGRIGADPVILTNYHSADSNCDGKIALLELTRVIELYNFRSGTTRTGQYHVQAGTEDGFAPGP
jgi:hypothetical protein